MDGRISGKVYGLIRRDQQILVEGIHETDGTLKAYRPLGGTIEFGEKSEDALHREFKEELGAALKVSKLFCVAEEIYEYHGHVGHQVAFIYECEFTDKGLYQQDIIERIDTEHGISIKAEWVDPFQLPHDVKLVPDDLLMALKKK